MSPGPQRRATDGGGTSAVADLDSVPLERCRALSRHTEANARRFAVRAEHLNPWCRVPGSPFMDGLLLLPNHPTLEQPVVSFGPIDDEQLSAVTGLFVMAQRPPHSSRLAVRLCVRDADGELLAEDRAVLRRGERAPLTARFPVQHRGVRVSVDVSFAEFDGGTTFPCVRMRYLCAYADNDLMRLFNAAGSDKGSEIYWQEGVPHLYALVYEPLLAPLRDQPLNLLEIGLDTASQDSGDPADAPSLRAWREFFPHATLFGYDINDFSFLRQRDTFTFRGDQSSPRQLLEFAEQYREHPLTVVIDDGSHVPAHQQTSLAHLFDHVVPSGLYVIEDLSWQPYAQTPTTAEVLRAYVQRGRIESPFIPPDRARRLEAAIDEVMFFRPNDSELAVIRKRG